MRQYENTVNTDEKSQSLNESDYLLKLIRLRSITDKECRVWLDWAMQERTRLLRWDSSKSVQVDKKE